MLGQHQRRRTTAPINRFLIGAVRHEQTSHIPVALLGCHY
jgi:hypothetical protein